MIELLTQLLASYMLLLSLLQGQAVNLGATLPLTDYKFRYIMRDDDGFITEAQVRFYEGAITTQDELQKNSTLVPITRYRRTKTLSTQTYTPKDFGRAKTNNELKVFLNGQLAKDKTRTPITEQK